MVKEHQAGGMAFIAGGFPPDPGKPSIVFIHGAGGSGLFWRNQVEALAARANTMAVDLPGHGQSPGPGMEKIEEYAEAVAGFIEKAAPGAVPVGLSMGGAITLQLLLDHPGRFPAAVLVSTGARLKVMPQIFETIEKDFPAFVALMGKFAASPKTPPERLAPVLEDIARREPEVVLGNFRACDRFDVSGRLGEIDAPVLVVSAEDDLLTPPKYSDFLEQAMQTVRRVHIVDSGHLIPVEKPEEFNRAVVMFLDEQRL